MSVKRKLKDMTADEFLAHGMDSDVSTGSEEEVTMKEDPRKEKLKEKKKKRKSQSESAKHKEHLHKLEQKDPEFYKFLKENDEELLAFSGSETEDDESDNGDVETLGDVSDESDKNISDSDSDEESLSVGKEAENADVDEYLEEEESEEEQTSKKVGKVVTQEMIKRWKAGLEKDSIKSLKVVMHAFHAAVQSLSPEESLPNQDVETIAEKKSKHRYVVEGGTTFNNLVTLCLRYTVKILEKHLDYGKTKKNKKKQLPSSSKQWSSIKTTVKQYLLDVLQLLRQLAEPTVLSIVLKHSHALLPYYASFPKIAKMLLKRSVRMWCTAEEHVRVLAFLGIRRLSILLPSLFEYALKSLYLGFVRNSKFVTSKTKPLVQFMQNSLVEMYALDENLTYQQAFVYIRQLAIHLRNAITNKKKESYQSVYNWQYISCLQLWCQVICDLYGDTLKPLVYPLVQITIGVISLIPSTRYYPLRFLCIKQLNKISEKTGVYIPTAAYILEAIEPPEFNKRPSSSEKPPDFNSTLKLTKPQLSTKAFQDTTVDLAFETLLEHYAIYSYSVAFPELIFPICHRIKKLIKSNRQVKLCKDMKTLVDKLQNYADEVTKERNLVTFAPKDIEQVRGWEENRNSQSNSLREFLKTWKNMRNVSADIQEEPVKESQEKDRKKNMKRKQKSGDKSQGSAKKTKVTKKQISKTLNDNEDIVEDFKFSDDE